jgi:PAS domain-containing protein
MERMGMARTPQCSSQLRLPVPHALTASGALYALVFEQSPVARWVVDATTLRFIAMNDAASSDIGYIRVELLNLTVLALCPSEDLAAILAPLGSLPP